MLVRRPAKVEFFESQSGAETMPAYNFTVSISLPAFDSAIIARLGSNGAPF